MSNRDSPTVLIKESDLVFGPFKCSQVFQVEKSEYARQRQHIKACEFALWDDKKGTLVLVEAKKSVPNPQNSQQEYQLFWQQIHDKFDNTMQLLLLGTLERPDTLRVELPEDMRALPWSTLKLVLYLVVPNVPDNFLPDLTNRFRQQMLRQQRLWQAELFVINRAKAHQKHLIK